MPQATRAWCAGRVVAVKPAPVIRRKEERHPAAQRVIGTQSQPECSGILPQAAVVVLHHADERRGEVGDREREAGIQAAV